MTLRKRVDQSFKQSVGGAVFLSIFGLPFLGVGVGMGYAVLSRGLTYWDARSWAEVPARIRSVDLERHAGDDGDTYEVVCEYEYERHGREYIASRVGLSGMSDNIGSWHRDTYRRLSAAHKSGTPVACYVNPSRPGESLLDRDLRYGELAFTTLFATLFGSMGLGVMSAGLTGWRAARRGRALARDYPNEPWLHDPDWAEGILRPRSLEVWTTIVRWLAVYWNAISLPVAFVAIPALAGPHWPAAALNLLYPLAGAGLIALAVYGSRARRRWGGSYLELDTVPGVIGGHLRGTLVVVGDVAALDRVDVTLKCSKHESRGDGSKVTVLHEDQRACDGLDTSFGQSELRIPLVFQIPGSLTPTGEDGSVRTVWQILVHASLPGPDLSLTFDVPVFVTEESDPALGKSPQMRAEESAVVLGNESPMPDRIRLTRIDATTRQLETSCWPNAGMVVGFAAVALVFAAADVFMIYQVIAGEWFLICMLAVFLPLTSLLPLAVVGMLGKFTVDAGREELRVRRSWGPFGRERRAALDRIKSIEYKESASAGSSKWYAVHALLDDGRKLKLAGMLPGELSARWFVRQVRESLGKPHSEELPLEMPVAPLEQE